MRDIRFRGKRLDNGEWVEGDLTRYSEAMSYITVDLLENECYQVDAETVGECTDIEDPFEKKVCEGDIIFFEGHKQTRSVIERVPDIGTGLYFKESAYGYFSLNEKTMMLYGIEVIGNIHDNPNLLEISE